jgi:hypothetical protein
MINEDFDLDDDEPIKLNSINQTNRVEKVDLSWINVKGFLPKRSMLSGVSRL